MRTGDSPGWKAKLPSAVAALSVQAAFFVALAFSFTVVTRAPEEEKETIFYLPRLPPKPPPEPMTIDARPKQPAAGAPPPAATSTLPPGAVGNGIDVLPGYAAAPSDRQLLQALGRASSCKPDEKGQLPSQCRFARPDPGSMALNPPSHVRNEDRWASEKARSDSPLVLPGGNPLGILITALTDPGAFLDKRNYKPAAPRQVNEPMRWADREYLRRYTSPQCPPGMGTDMERRGCAANAAALGKE